MKTERFLFIGLLAEPPDVTEMNLAFALSATSLDADRTLGQMKEIMKSMIEKYSLGKIYYSIISFGVPLINFDNELTKEDLKETIDQIRKTSGKADLDKTLDEARKLFKTVEIKRPNADNNLVIIVDKKSDSKLEDIAVSSGLLEEQGVKVITIGIGEEVDETEIETTTGNKNNVILANKTDDPSLVAEEVVEKVEKGEACLFFFRRRNKTSINPGLVYSRRSCLLRSM